MPHSVATLPPRFTAWGLFLACDFVILYLVTLRHRVQNAVMGSAIGADHNGETNMNATTYKIGTSALGTTAWALRWPALGGVAGKWSIRWEVPGRAFTAEALCVVDDFGQLVQVFA